MDADLLLRCLEAGGRDFLLLHPSSPPSPTSASAASASSSSILQSLPLHVSFDRGYYLLVKAIQELRERKDGLVVTVGIGGPTGSGKTSLAEKVASVLGCVVIVSMENYRMGPGADEGSDVDAIDFDALACNLQVMFVQKPSLACHLDNVLLHPFQNDLVKGKDTLMPLVDFQEKKRTGWRQLKISSSGVVIVDGAYALHSTLRSLLDIRVAVVGGVHFSLLSKVQHDIGDSCSLDYLIDSIFPLFRKHIEPDLHHAQIRIDNSFVCSFREPYYKLKCKNEETSNKDLSLLAKSTLELLKWRNIRRPFLETAIMAMLSSANDPNWRTRSALLSYLRTFTYRHTFVLSDSEKSQIWQTIEKLLVDNQVEVREHAAGVLASLMKGIDKDISKDFRDRSYAQAQRILDARTSKSGRSVANIHGAVLALTASVLSIPYDMPSWLPGHVTLLANFIREPSPIRSTVTKAVAEFKRTHADTWSIQKDAFTEDELEILRDTSSSSSYFS